LQTLSIGRSATNDIVVDHRTVSRKHAEIDVLDDGMFHIRDYESANGTYVKIENVFHRSAEARIGEADIVRFGSFESSVANLILLSQKRPTKPRRRKAADKNEPVQNPDVPSERLNPLDEVRPTQPVGRMSREHKKIAAQVQKPKFEKPKEMSGNTTTVLIALSLVAVLVGVAFLAYWILF